MVPINKRTIGTCIALSIVTFGIYFIYWEYLLVKKTRAIQKDGSSCTGEMLCLVLVPFYNLYWWFTRGKTVNEEFSKHGYTAKGNEIAYLVLGIFGLNIISAAIMQNDFNSLKSENFNAKMNEYDAIMQNDFNSLKSESTHSNQRSTDKNTAIITFKDVSKTYILYKNDQARFKALFFKPKNPKTNKALNKVSFSINRGESVGIVGDNGAGKSTLLKMITGVAFPDEGEITVDGKVAALLELTAGFSPEMTGRENIYLKGYILGLEDDYIKEIEESIIEFAELGDYIDQPVRTYSSGMKMRLGFAINVNIEPDVLVVDEALAVGDASFKRKCKDKIKSIISAGTTVLYVSHNADSVKEICPRAIYLRKGSVIYDGKTEDTLKVYHDYKESQKKKKK